MMLSRYRVSADAPVDGDSEISGVLPVFLLPEETAVGEHHVVLGLLIKVLDLVLQGGQLALEVVLP